MSGKHHLEFEPDHTGGKVKISKEIKLPNLSNVRLTSTGDSTMITGVSTSERRPFTVIVHGQTVDTNGILTGGTSAFDWGDVIDVGIALAKKLLSKVDTSGSGSGSGSGDKKPPPCQPIHITNGSTTIDIGCNPA